MPGVSVRIDSGDIARINRRISKLLHDTLDLHPVMEEAAEYMKRSTVNRIKRSKTGPDGERWQALSDVTVALKGHNQQLFQSGELADSVEILDVDKESFMLTAEAPYASYMQKGVDTVKGAFKSSRPRPQIVARPFMGFSDENVRRISKMIRDYLAGGGE